MCIYVRTVNIQIMHSGNSKAGILLEENGPRSLMPAIVTPTRNAFIADCAMLRYAYRQCCRENEPEYSVSSIMENKGMIIAIVFMQFKAETAWR